MAVRPILQALLVADAIYVDASTGKKIIAGTFNRLVCEDFPATTVVSKHALISLTDVHRSVEIGLRFVDLSTGESLLELHGLVVEADDPLETVELVVELPPLPLPHAGAYALEVHWQDELLGLLRLYIDSPVKESPAGEEDHEA